MADDSHVPIGDKFLQDIGLGDLPIEEKDLLLDQIKYQLEQRVGTWLADNMDEQQMAEFDATYVQNQDHEGAAQWLQQNFPNYPQKVAEEAQKLKEELKPQAGTIREIIRQQQQEQQQPQPQQEYQQQQEYQPQQAQQEAQPQQPQEYQQQQPPPQEAQQSQQPPEYPYQPPQPPQE
jgi:chemotaxis protein histidine kinase CheA